MLSWSAARPIPIGASWAPNFAKQFPSKRGDSCLLCAPAAKPVVKSCLMLSIHKRDPAVGEIVDGADNAELVVLDSLAQDRCRGLHSGDGEDDVLSDRIVEVVARLINRCLDGR